MIFSPLASKLRRLRNPHIRAADVAIKTWTVSPAEESICPSAIFFPDELERVTGYAAHSNRGQELERLTPHRTTRQPTKVSELENVVACGGNLYVGAFKYPMRDTRLLLASIHDEREDGGVPCSSWLGGMYFGHWLAEDTSLKLLAEPYGNPTEIDFFQTPHQIAYNELFGIERCIIPDNCHYKTLTMLECDLFSGFRNEGWRQMTAAIDARFDAKPHIGCMLLRGTSGSKRLLLNENLVADALRAMGFRIIDPSACSLEEILAAAAGSRIVVGVEGSQLAHGFHCLREGCALVVLQPPNRFGCIDKYRCDAKRVRYAFSVCHEKAEGFTADLDSVMQILELVIGDLRRHSQDGLA